MEPLKIDEIDKNEIADECGLALESSSSDEGDSTSIESEFNKPFKPRDIKIDVKPIPIERIIKRFDRKEIILNPDFQRKSVWDIKRKCRLIESLMLNIPLPIFYVSADENGIWSVVDGQQRLTAGQRKCAENADAYIICNENGKWAEVATNCKFHEKCQDDGQCILQKDKVDFGIWYSTWYAYTKWTSDSNRENTWTAWDIPYRPLLMDGSFGMYDSKNALETEYYISQISDAGIDFIIMDQTNNIDVDGGYINERSLATAEVCKKYIDSHPDKRPVKYCSAIGGIQWSQDPATIEAEAKKLWERYDSSETYHYYVDGKPLLIVYIGNLKEELWNNYQGDKTYASKFTIRFADNDSRPGYYGWAYDKGAQLHSEVSVIMPGWDNRKGATPVKRNAGEWYKQQFDILRKASTLPKIIVINSFNEYAEGTAVWSADTDISGNSDKWTDSSGQLKPDMYWNMTVDFIKEIRGK